MSLSTEQIKLLQSYRDKSYILSVLCIECSDFYSFIRSLINIPLILSSSVMTILNSYNKINSDDLQISNIILNASTALILSLSSNLKINEKIINFKNIGLKMNKYCSHLEDFLTNHINEITNDEITKFIDDYNNINEQIEYSFVGHIKERIKKKYDGKKILPNQLNCITSFITFENSNNV